MKKLNPSLRDVENLGKKDLKDYSSKLPVDEFQWLAIGHDRGLAGVFKFAQEKYGNISSWRNRDDGSVKRYRGAMLRHMIAIMIGEDIDPESKLPHLSHLMWCVASLLEFYIQDEEKGKKK